MWQIFLSGKYIKREMYVLIKCEKFSTKLFQHFRQENLLSQDVTTCEI